MSWFATSASAVTIHSLSGRVIQHRPVQDLPDDPSLLSSTTSSTETSQHPTKTICICAARKCMLYHACLLHAAAILDNVASSKNQKSLENNLDNINSDEQQDIKHVFPCFRGSFGETRERGENLNSLKAVDHPKWFKPIRAS
ncbi:hypothetical protein QM012_003092 [Aureobasidium pullulans]|uniref:Uncharacterized protein n=1 Tax=Aureobasidium pullulans TaxID=5580 RepID=A0ABR0T990_AURPU